MKFSFRKIASVLTSAVMLGSTIGFAANFPEPFVKDGVADAAVVHGATATLDLAAATSIQQSLAAGVKTTVTTVEGESYNFGGKKDLNLGESITVVRGTLDEDHLPTLLASGTYENDERNNFDYEQKITMAGLTVTHIENDEDNNLYSILGVNLKQDDPILNYTLDFTEAAESDVTSSGHLEDLENTVITMMGKEYFILDALNGTNPKLTMLDSANTVDVYEGTPATVNVGGKTYTISASIYGENKVKLTVNSETTKSMGEGDTYKLSDGTYVGVKEVLYISKETGTSAVEVSIGSGKIELINNDEIKLNGEEIDGIKSYISLGSSGSKTTLEAITIEWLAEDDVILSSEGTSSLTMPGIGGIKVIMGGLNVPSTEKVEVKNDGTQRIVLKVPLKGKESGQEIYLLESNESGGFKTIGQKSSKRLKTAEGTNIKLNTTAGEIWAVASYGSGTNWESYLLEVTKVTDENKTSIKIVNTDSDLFVEKEKGETKDLGDKLKIKIEDVVWERSSDGIVNLSLTSGSGSSFDKVHSLGGLTIYLPVDKITPTNEGDINLTEQPSSWKLYMREQDSAGSVNNGEWINVTVGFNNDQETSVKDVTANWVSSLYETGEETDLYDGYVKSPATTKVVLDKGPDQQTLKVEYHNTEDEESYVDFFVAAPGVTTGGAAGVLVVKDSEASSVASKNLVVVGGSCVNTLAAQMLGSSVPMCGEEFTAKTGVGAGQALIKVAASPLNSEKIAMLIAGYEADDTSKAATYVVTSKPSTAVGSLKFDSSTLTATAA